MQYDNLGAFIRNKRKKLSFSLSSFSLNNDIDPATLSNFERGLTGITFNTLIKIANGFGKSPAEFLTEFENSKFR